MTSGIRAERGELPVNVFTEFASSGLWPGVGPAVAQSMIEAGMTSASTVTVAALAALPKMTPRRADRLYTSWIGAGQAYAVAQLLVPQDIPVRWAGRLMEALGDDAADLLSADPWRLLVLPDATVAQADRVAQAVDPAVQRADARRARSLVDWTLARFARQGHTAASAQQVADALRPFNVDAGAAVAAAAEADLVSLVDGPPSLPEQWVARKVLAQAENDIAEHIGRLTTTAHSLAGARAVAAVVKELDTVQAGAVTLAAQHGVSLLTGGPGTGKSRTIAAVVALCTRVGVDLALAAPTGRAAKRLEELAGAPATTIHRLLGARRGDAGSNGFDRNQDNPIEAGLVVVDEASMLDVELAAALLCALPDGTPPGDRRRSGAAAVDRAGPGARRPDRQRRAPSDGVDDPVPPDGGRRHRPAGDGGPRRRPGTGDRPDPGGGGGTGPRLGGRRPAGRAAGHRLHPAGVRHDT